MYVYVRLTTTYVPGRNLGALLHVSVRVVKKKLKKKFARFTAEF